jgi:hypothetical protein
MAASPIEEHAILEPRFPDGMRNAVTTYASSASTDVAAYEDLPDHHLLAVMNLITSTNDESYNSSASKLPPATSHGYAEWDFSGVPDPVMFQRFLNAGDYWFVYADTSSTGSYDPARECFMVAIGDEVDDARSVGAGDGEPPGTQERARPHLVDGWHLHQPAAGPSARNRGEADGGVPRGTTPACHHHLGSLRSR